MSQHRKDRRHFRNIIYLEGKDESGNLLHRNLNYPDFKNSLLLLVTNIAIINHNYILIMLIHLLFNLCGASTSLHQGSL